MVMHWRRKGGAHARTSMLVNGIGAISTGIAVCIILVAKFTEGAWITALLIPSLMLLMYGIRRHYDSILRETADPKPADLKDIPDPLVVLPMDSWNRVSEKALRFAYILSNEIRVLHIVTEENAKAGPSPLQKIWHDYVEKPAKNAGRKPPELVILNSPYRYVVTPIYEYILELERKNPDRYVAVLVPELVERRWLYYLLHSQRATALKVILYRKGDRRIIVINVPWHLKC
jgi:hypothetical protein